MLCLPIPLSTLSAPTLRSALPSHHEKTLPSSSLSKTQSIKINTNQDTLHWVCPGMAGSDASSL